MAYKKTGYQEDEEVGREDVTHQREIIIQRHEEIGRVQLGNGPGSAITAAFTLSGEYISEKLGPGVDGNITIEFSLDGMNFIAKVES